MIRRIVIAAAVALLVGVGHANAEDLVSIDVGANAQGTGKSVKRKALDSAFGKAVQQVLRKMLPKSVRTQNRVVLRDEIRRRARLFVGSYKILDERRIEGELRIQVTVKVDRDKIRAALAELNIAAQASTFDHGGGGSRPRVVVLLKYSGDSTTSTTFGSTGGDGGTAGRAFSAELRAQGFDVIDASATQAPLGEDAQDRLPLGDDAALALARELGAGGAFIVGIDASTSGNIRGTNLVGAAGKGSIRVLDARSGKLVSNASVAAASYATDEAGAIASTATKLARKAMLGVTEKVVRHWPPTRARSDQLEVRVRGAKTWAAVAEIIRKLAATKGVRGVHAVRVETGRINLAVDADVSAKKIASQLKKLRLRRGRASVKLKDGRILVKVSGDSRFSGEP